MTKSELISAIAAAPDTAAVTIDRNDRGILHSQVTADAYEENGEWTIIIVYTEMSDEGDDMDFGGEE